LKLEEKNFDLARLWECVEKISKTLTTWIERLQRLKLEEKKFFLTLPNKANKLQLLLE